MEITGVIKKIGEVQEFGSNGFTKREIVLETLEQYPQILCIELHKDKTNLSEKLTEGETVTFAVNLRGKEWVNPEGVSKYFMTLVGWKLVGDFKASKNEPKEAEEDDAPF